LKINKLQSTGITKEILLANEVAVMPIRCVENPDNKNVMINPTPKISA
jgi:hypothetical protein